MSDHSPQQILAQICGRGSSEDHAPVAPKCVKRKRAPEGWRNSAPPLPKPPRRPIGAGGVRGASRSGSASVLTTHALFAHKVQRKLVLLALPPADHLLIE